MAYLQKQSPVQKQALKLGQAQLQGIRLLSKSLPDLRAEIIREMNANPAIESLENTLETPFSDVDDDEAYGIGEETEEADYPREDYEPTFGADDFTADEKAAERRQAFFDSQVKAETLQEHLLKQLPLSDIPPADWPIVEVLVGDLNDDGFYTGSLADVQMAFGKSEQELSALLAKIREFDPAGCGARTAKECLAAQLDDLSSSPNAATVARIVADHLDDLAAGRIDEIARALKLTSAEARSAVATLRTLNPHPGRAYPGEHDRVEYVNPEIHAVKAEDRWIAATDDRSLPEIRISDSFRSLGKDPEQSAETRAFAAERLAAAEALKIAVRRRCDTVRAVAQAIFDRQGGFFTRGVGALKPLTEEEIAKAVGVSVATVSRAVCDKYATTPFGTFELRRFFPLGVRNAAGETISRSAAEKHLAALVASEDKAKPLSDEQLASALKLKGIAIARRTVAKYRDQLGIPGAFDRRLAK